MKKETYKRPWCIPNFFWKRLQPRTQQLARHIPYVLDGSTPALILGLGGLIALFYAWVVLPLWVTLVSVVVCGGLVSSSADVLGFAKILKGIPGRGDSTQLIVKAVQIADRNKSIKDPNNYTEVHEKSTVAYRVIQIFLIDVVAILWLPVHIVWNAGIAAHPMLGVWGGILSLIILALSLGILKWSGATDDGYHLLQGNDMGWHGGPEPWTTWKPFGWFKFKITGEHATGKQNVIQSMIGLIIAVSVLVAGSIWLG